MKPSMNLMSGLRLTPGGIHLGHYLGCLTPLDHLNDDILYFVIRDRGLDIENISSPNYKNLVDILIDLSSTKYAGRINFVLQSKLQVYFAPIFEYIQDIVTLNQLNNVHPQRKKIKNKLAVLSIKDYLFPIESACTYFILDADRILMNDDNMATVKFAYNVSKKISTAFNKQIFTYPVLLHGKLPRLLGYNYEKVCKANNNAIFLSDSAETLENKLNKFLTFKYLFRKEPYLAEQRSNLREDFIIPDNFLPFQYMRIFSDQPDIEKQISDLKSLGRIMDLNITFKKIMHTFFLNIRERRNEAKKTEKSLLEKLYGDTRNAEIIAKGVLERFLFLK